MDLVEIQRLIATAREDHTVELKRALPQGRRHLRTLCAFANGRGGTLIVGVGDRGQVVGVHDARKVAQNLRDELRKHVRPPLPAHVAVVPLPPGPAKAGPAKAGPAKAGPAKTGPAKAAGAREVAAQPLLVVVRVQAGKEGPYAAHLLGGGWQCYVREKDRTVPLPERAAETVAAPEREGPPADRLAMEALALLGRARQTSAPELAQALNLSGRRAGRLLTGLVRAGLAVAHEEPRAVRYALTPQGRAMVGKKR